jgi:hypothetical protein
VLAYRAGWPPHLVAGVTEADYVASGLAWDVAAELERELVKMDKKDAEAVAEVDKVRKAVRRR